MSQKLHIGKKAPAGCLVPFGLIFLASGLAVCWFAWTRILSKVRMVHSWTETPCQVSAWKLEVKPTGDGYSMTPTIDYDYDFSGGRFTGNTYDLASTSTPEINEFEELGAKARTKGAVCYVNPAQPEESSFLRAGYAMGGFVLGMGLLFAGVGGLILLRGLFGLLMGITGNQAQGTGVAKGCVGGILAPIVCTLLVVAGFAVWKLALADQPDWTAISARMVPIPATVVASGVQTTRKTGKNNSTTHKVRLAYRYDFGGRSWHSAWLDFDRGTRGSKNHSKALEAANRFPEGASTTAWVNPDAPWQAVLEKSGGTSSWLWLFPIFIGGAGVVGLLVWLLKVTALGAALFGPAAKPQQS